MSTLKDIAKASGVSTATVSYVLNRNSGVKISDSTRKKVMEIAKQLRYEPNALARSVRTGHSKIIALVTSSAPPTSYFFSVFNSICQTATGYDFSVKVYSLETSGQQILKMLTEQRVSGVMFYGADFREFEELAGELKSRAIPVAAVNCRAATADCPSFVSDEKQGVWEAVRCLCEADCRKIVCVSHSGNFDYIRLREEGYCTALKHFMPDSTPQILKSDSFDCLSPDEPLRKLLTDPAQRPDGFFCLSDGHAYHLYQLAYHMGIRIPDDISIVGYGNLLGSDVAMVPLTTTRQNFPEMGRLATEAVISAALKRESSDGSLHELPVELIMRDSVKKKGEI